MITITSVHPPREVIRAAVDRAEKESGLLCALTADHPQYWSKLVAFGRLWERNRGDQAAFRVACHRVGITVYLAGEVEEDYRETAFFWFLSDHRGDIRRIAHRVMMEEDK